MSWSRTSWRPFSRTCSEVSVWCQIFTRVPIKSKFYNTCHTHGHEIESKLAGHVPSQCDSIWGKFSFYQKSYFQLYLFVTFVTNRHQQNWKKQTPWTPRSSIFKKIFHQIVQIFGSLNVQIRNNFKNIIFIACKWCKICKYYVNSMVKYLNIIFKYLNIWLTLFCRD